MDGAPKGITASDARRGQDEDSHYARVRRRLALLQVFAASLEQVQGESRRRQRMNDPTDAETARATANIAAWRSYLPEDCVTAMIKAGWHWST